MKARVLVALAIVALTIVPLGAELRITSRVDVRKTAVPKHTFTLSTIAPLMRFRLTAAKVEVTTYVDGDRVRVEGLGPVLGLASDVYLISRPDGTTLCVQPSDRTFFISHISSANEAAKILLQLSNAKVSTTRKPSGIILAHRTERVVNKIDMRIRRKAGDGADETIDRWGRFVPAWTLDETPEERERRWMSSAGGEAANPAPDVITIETWESSAFGAASLVATKAGSSVTSIGSAGFASQMNLGFGLRQIITNPAGGYRLESRVTAVSPQVVPAALFEVPAGFTEVPLPGPSPLLPKISRR